MEIFPGRHGSNPSASAGKVQIERSNSDASSSSSASSSSVLLKEKDSDGLPIDEEEDSAGNLRVLLPPPPPPPALMNRSFEDDEEEEDVCRICRNPGDADNPLRYPCACSGSIKFVHQDCLLQWLNHSNARQCEVCSLFLFCFSVVRLVFDYGRSEKLLCFDCS